MKFTDQSRQRETTRVDVLVAEDATEVFGRPILARIGNLLLVAADPSTPWRAAVFTWRQSESETEHWFTEVNEYSLIDLVLLGAHAAIHQETFR